jgi:hypothetical protein
MTERRAKPRLSLDDAISRLLDCHCEEIAHDMPGEPMIRTVRPRDYPTIWNEHQYADAWRVLWRYRMLTRGTLPK